MNTFSVSRLALMLAFSVTLSACSSLPPDQQPSTQSAPGTASRPILSADEANTFTTAHYFAAQEDHAAGWQPTTITPPGSPDFVVGPAGASGVTHTTIQAAVDAAMARPGNHRQFIAIQPGEYAGTVYVPASPVALTLYGTGERASEVKIKQTIDAGMNIANWRQQVNPAGKYIPGKPAWYMFNNCQSQQETAVGMMCSAVFWSQNNGLQLQNLTIANLPENNADAGAYQAVALRSDGDKVQLDRVNLIGRQNTFLVTNSDIQNRLQPHRQTRTLVNNCYLEGQVDIVSGRGTVVFRESDFYVVDTHSQQETYVFAPATERDSPYGFLVINSRLIAPGNGVAHLGRSLDLDDTANGQIVIRDSIINEGFDTATPWGAAALSSRAFRGNTGSPDDSGHPQRQLNDNSVNRMWEYNNRGAGSLMTGD
ncbi:putative acyl-CoA thioester hydrolase [Enterobacteriaceae bacterium ESL0689]|nr:putative acyl-CoA thioester hydrolase [Enterobacteriaceae bacterium ESL0689]